MDSPPYLSGAGTRLESNLRLAPTGRPSGRSAGILLHMHRWLYSALALATTSACGLLEDDGPGPAPVNESQGQTATAAASTAGDESDGSDVSSGSGATSMMPADTTAGVPDIGMGVVLSGEIGMGVGNWTTPMPCSVRFFLEDQLDPQDGASTEWEAEIPIVIEEFPHALTVMYDDLPDTLGAFSETYIGIRCDFDNDGINDNVGGFHPGLPAELVTLPFDDVTLGLEFL